MNKFILSLFFIWIIWKVLQSVSEEIRARMEKEARKQPELLKRSPNVAPRRGENAPREQPLPPPSPDLREPALRQTGRPAPARPEDELQRLLLEGLKRKRQMAPPTHRPAPTKEAAYTERPMPKLEEEGREEKITVLQRREPPIEHRRPARVEQRRVARPQEPPPAPATRQWASPSETPKRRRVRETVERGVREKPPVLDLMDFVEWDLNEIRRGFVIGEILGPPMALRDADSHLI
ncbi:hypothetical protein HZA56_00865 [Candidatus Poribacteria bacterium]|nr:hypothetical protein [Candidatus Poribacteria bacterium]